MTNIISLQVETQIGKIIKMQKCVGFKCLNKKYYQYSTLVKIKITVLKILIK